MVLLLGAASVIIGGGLTYAAGLFDKVKFEEKDSLLENPDKTELIAIVAKCQEKYIGKNIMHLLKAGKKGIDHVRAGTKPLQASAAANYGAPAGADSLSIGLYFDDPQSTEHPRWAVGWCIDVDFETAQRLAQKMREIVAGPYDSYNFEAVRIANAPVIRGRIPWRTTLTAAVAPLLWWGKAMKTYNEGGYTANGNTNEEGAVALEVYVMGPNMKRAYIDYVVLYDDVKSVWSDLYPSDKDGGGAELETMSGRS